MKQPVLFITISRGGTAQNILKSRCYEVLKSSGMHIVILTPAWEDQRFLDEFAAPNVEFVPLYETDWTRRDNIFVGLAKALVYNTSTEMRDKYGIYSQEEASAVRYWIKRTFFKPFRNVGWIKELIRAIDALIVPDRYYKKLFGQYKPIAVFSTSIIEDVDVYVLKRAKAEGVPIIGMPKSWDNLSKMFARVKPDRLLVWGPYSKGEAITFQNMKPKDIRQCGIPQFDPYVHPSFLLTREAFCQKFHMDPNEKIIVYASEGKVSKHDPDIIDMLLKGINRDAYGMRCQVFVRPHFIYRGDTEKFARFIHVPGVSIDDTYTPSSCFRDQWDYSDGQMEHKVNLLHHCDLMITSNSTMTLDAAFFDKPVINIAFDGYTSRPMGESIAKWFTTEYYRQVVESGAPWVVRSEDDLHRAVRMSLHRPQDRQKQRKELVQFFCGENTGHSGEKIGREIINFLDARCKRYE